MLPPGKLLQAPKPCMPQPRNFTLPLLLPDCPHMKPSHSSFPRKV